MTKRMGLFWISGTIVLLAPPIWRSVASPVPPSARTPVDRTNPLYARQWRLLEQAAGVIPAGESYTTVAGNPDHEMLLFMLARAALPDRVAHPTRYWGTAQAAGPGARYVVAFECSGAEGGALVVARFEEGCVLQRPSRPR